MRSSDREGRENRLDPSRIPESKMRRSGLCFNKTLIKSNKS